MSLHSVSSLSLSHQPVFYVYTRLGATISVLREKSVESGQVVKRVAEVLVRKVPENQQVGCECRVQHVATLPVNSQSLS